MTPGEGNDTVIIDAGSGDDTITYDVGPGTDTATIDGGTGTDTLIVNQPLGSLPLPVLIQDNSGQVIYQFGVGGTTITVVNMEHISVLDEEGKVIFSTSPLTPSAPPLVPVLPSDGGFDKVITDPAETGDVMQIAMGTSGKDRIAQYGGTGTVIQLANGNTGDDWILQVCGGTACTQKALAGDGNDTVYQFVTGNGPATINAIGGTTGNQTFIQVGGSGVNTMMVDDSVNSGSAHIELYGGPAGNTMDVAGSKGNDLIAIYGGGGNDDLAYDLTAGTDTVLINAGGGTDTLTINRNSQTNYGLKTGIGSVLFTSGTGGTAITVVNVEHLRVLDEHGSTIFQWDAP